MLGLESPYLWILAPVFYSLADRIAGGGIFGKKDIPFASDIAAGILLLTFTFIANLTMWPFVVAWLIWRAPAWKIGPYGGTTPRSFIDGIAVYARNLYMAPVVLFAYLAGYEWQMVAMGTALWALVSTILAFLLAMDEDEDNVALMEHLRGLFFGILVASATIYLR